ncbi:MAG: galactokinase [Planctomycetes bacterium]|nr:galactokinase [Planctomycetota bacterium]
MESATRDAFERAFGRPPVRAARAPGRVNLIGEHIDYCGLAVLPMAIERAVRIAFVARPDARVRLVNADGARFGPREFDLSTAIDPAPRGDWSNYARAAAQALAREHGARCGIDALVAGDVPPAAGLSSSSALVVACTLALSEANGIDARREMLMDLCARAEHYVGVESGGMDQAASLGGQAGCAVLVEFDPVRATPVPIPAEWQFVVARSAVGVEKSGRAREAYNARVAECRAALAGVRAAPAARGWPSTWRALVADIEEQRLLALSSTTLDGLLSRRFRHVVTEGFRVQRAVRALERADAAEFGRLMDLSHASLRDDFEVSCPELEALTAAARAAGALGARLTGAGFGGAIVALTRADEAGRIESALRAHPVAARDHDAVFRASAAAGASLGS